MFDPDFGRVADIPLRVVSGWQRRQVGTEREHQHQGMDIPVPVGTVIRAAADGVVVTAHPRDDNDAGIHVAVTHPSGVTSRYLHLSQLSVSNGQHVTKGRQVGLSGNTGLSEGPHLHFDLWAPQTLLGEIGNALGMATVPTGAKFSFGYSIPGEPWLPVDSYTAPVIANAIAKGLPLYSGRKHGGTSSRVVTGILIGLTIGALWAAYGAVSPSS